MKMWLSVVWMVVIGVVVAGGDVIPVGIPRLAQDSAENNDTLRSEASSEELMPQLKPIR